MRDKGRRDFFPLEGLPVDALEERVFLDFLRTGLLAADALAWLNN